MRFPKSPRLVRTALAFALTTGLALAQHGVGVVVDRGRPASSTSGGRAPYVHAFDPDTLRITGSVALPIPPFSAVFDVEIAPDLSKCYIGDNGTDQLWTIDLTTSPPRIAAGPNPLQLDGGNEDLALSPDGRYLVCGTGDAAGQGGTNLAIVDTRTRVQTDTVRFTTGAGTSPVAVEFAPDGSFVVNEQTFASAQVHRARFRRFRIDSQGHAVDTGDALPEGIVPGGQDLIVPNFPQLPHPINLLVSRHVVVVSRPAAGLMTSLRTDGLVVSQSIALDYPTGIDLSFDSMRSIVYARTIENDRPGPAGDGNSRIDGYFFSPITGRFSPNPIVTIRLEKRAGTAYGVEQTALDAKTRRMFVSGLGGGEIRVFDSLTAARVGTITDPDLLFALGVAVRRR